MNSVKRHVSIWVALRFRYCLIWYDGSLVLSLWNLCLYLCRIQVIAALDSLPSHNNHGTSLFLITCYILYTMCYGSLDFMLLFYTKNQRIERVPLCTLYVTSSRWNILMAWNLKHVSEWSSANEFIIVSLSYIIIKNISGFCLVLNVTLDINVYVVCKKNITHTHKNTMPIEVLFSTKQNKDM